MNSNTRQIHLNGPAIGVFETRAPVARSGESVPLQLPLYAEVVVTPQIVDRLVRLQGAIRQLGVQEMRFVADALVRWAPVADPELAPGGLTDVMVASSSWQMRTGLKFRVGRDYRTPEINLERMVGRLNDVLACGEVRCYFGIADDAAFEMKARPLVEPNYEQVAINTNVFADTEVTGPGMAP